MMYISSASIYVAGKLVVACVVRGFLFRAMALIPHRRRSQPSSAATLMTSANSSAPTTSTNNSASVIARAPALNRAHERWDR